MDVNLRPISSISPPHFLTSLVLSSLNPSPSPFLCNSLSPMDSSKPTTSTRKPCFLQDDDDDDGLASLAADMETGISGHHFFSRPLFSRSFRSLSAVAGSRPSHFLDSCFLCRKPLGNDTDIFMYRGDTPFCSEECRQEQIEIDEAKERKWRRSSSAAMKTLRKKDQQRRRSASPNKSSPPPDYPFRAGTVAAA